jgi:hypothetical protein
MLTLAASQADLAGRTAFAPVPLFVFTTYTDYPAKTGATVRYWSTIPFYYDWAGTGVQYFSDVVKGIGELALEMPHLPLGLGNELGTPRFRLEVVNEDGLWAAIRGAAFGELEYAELLVNPDRFLVDRHAGRRSGRSGWWDLRDLPGTEHVFRFRGELIDHEIVEDDHTFSLEFRTVHPEVPVVELLESGENDPKDFGSVLPIIYGAVKRNRCRNLKVGRQTAFSEPLTDITTGVVQVTDATGLPTSTTFYIISAREVIQCSDSDAVDGTITISARAQNGTHAVAHPAGEIVLELLDEIIVGIAGHPCSGWTGSQALYCISPYTGELVRFTEGVIFNVRDQTAIDGKTITTARIKQEQLEDFLISTNNSPRVSVQPEIAGTGGNPGPFEETPDDQTVDASPSFSRGYWSDVDTTTPRWTGSPFFSRSRLKCEWGPGPYNNTNDVLRWRIKLSVTFASVSDWSRVYLYPKDIPGFEEGYSIRAETKDFDTTKTVYSEWRTPPAGTKYQNLIADNSYFLLYATGASASSLHVVGLTMYAEVADATPTVRDVDTRIEAGSVGYGLQFFADVIGYTIPYYFTTDYAFTEGTGWNQSNGVQSDQGANGQRLLANAGPVTATMQRTNTAAEPLDLNAQNDRYRISLLCDNPALLDPDEDLLIWFSDTVGTGTTPPATRMELKIPRDQLKAGEWVAIEIDGVEAGTPALTDVETIGLEFVTLSGTPYVQVKNLEGGDATNPDYHPTLPGSGFSKISSVLKHFLITHCGLGSGVIGDSFAVIDAGLIFAWAGDLTTYGTTFEPIVAGIAAESGTNVIREEGSAGSVYEMFFADEASGVWKYPATVRTLDEWNRLTERLRPSDQAATRFRAFWAWDSSRGNDSRSFREVSRADADVNDTAVAGSAFTNAELRMGPRDADPFAFYLVQVASTAEEILGFYAHELLDLDRAAWTMVLPPWLSWDLQRGDTVTFTPSWDGSPRSARILGIRRQFDVPQATLTLAEVVTL